jgi:phospholipase C
MKENGFRYGWRCVVPLGVLLSLGPIMAPAARAGAATKKVGPSELRDIPIKHIIIIFQENRSFDSYFGMYPGADGIPIRNGVPTVCVPDPRSGQCVKPYLDHGDVSCGGPHGDQSSLADVADGAMNGFVREIEAMGGHGPGAYPLAWARHYCQHPNTDPRESDQVMAYHDGGDIPNYWAYARNFVLQDRMFESVHSWSFPSHLFLVSAWSAICGQANNPMSCVSALLPNDRTLKNPTPFAWTEITYLLHKARVSWVYYLDHGALPPRPPRLEKEAEESGIGVPAIWNVLPGFSDVHEDDQLADIEDLSRFYEAAKAGALPSVSWISPDGEDSEHPPARVSVGQSYVTSIVNAAMRSPGWKSTAIFITWDDWGGFYDHAVPPRVDSLGLGIRVPGLAISPYAKRGYVDHQTLSFDAYLKFIEDLFLNGQRLNPRTDGRPDSRPDVREDSVRLGNLMNDFDFSQQPRPPLLLPVHPKTTLVENQP